MGNNGRAYKTTQNNELKTMISHNWSYYLLKETKGSSLAIILPPYSLKDYNLTHSVEIFT